MFESQFAKDFFNDACPAYKLPSRDAISGPLLDNVYKQVKNRTEQVVEKLLHINVITDESTDINTARICNISIHSPRGSLHYLSEDIRAMQTTAATSAQWLRNHLNQVANHNPDRINSITNDTGATMFSMWEEVEKFPEFKHVFFIPCDSHGIQLLFKDLLKIPRFNDTIQQAQAVVTAFRKAPLQYARLRTCQQACYGRHISLVLSVITRWGTQYRLVESVLKSKDALKRYVCDYEDLPANKRIKQPVIDIIKQREFWNGLELMRELLKPMDVLLKMSESGQSHLGHVLNRWMDFLKHLREKRVEIDELDMFISANGTFSQRYTRQVLPIHIVAYYLMPETTLCDRQHPDRTKASIPVHMEQQITAFFRRYTSSEADAKILIREFLCFRAQQPPFEPARIFWEESGNPSLFWDLAMGDTHFLSRIASRIFSTPVNSVASERAFSVRNVIHTKTRNRLHSAKADKLAYLYTNARVLARLDGKVSLDSFYSKNVDSLSNDEEVTLENMLLEIEAEDSQAGRAISGGEGENIEEEEVSEATVLMMRGF